MPIVAQSDASRSDNNASDLVVMQLLFSLLSKSSERCVPLQETV